MRDARQPVGWAKPNGRANARPLGVPTIHKRDRIDGAHGAKGAFAHPTILRFAEAPRLILRSRALARRLEGWTQRIDSRPSFETRATRAPQDEAVGPEQPL